MATKSDKIFKVLENHPRSAEIYSFCVGWLKSHFSKRESIKFEEIIEMLEESVAIQGESEKTEQRRKE